MAIIVNSKLGLPEPFPSSPLRPPQFGLWANKYYFTFCQPYAIHKFATTLLEDRDYKWLDEQTILTDDGIKLKGNLELALEYEPKGKEAEWEIPSPYREQIARIRGELPQEPKEEKPKKEKPKKEKPKKEKKTRPAPDGLVTIAQLAEELRKKPAELRKRLRASKEEKPSHGWAWSPEEIKRIKKLLSRA